MGDIGLGWVRRVRRQGPRGRAPLAIAVLAIGAVLAAVMSLPGSADAATGWGSLPTPTMHAARLADGTVRLSWTSSAGAQKYDLYLVTGSKTKWLTSVPAPATSTVISSVAKTGALCFAGNALTRNGVSFSKMSATTCVGTSTPAAPASGSSSTTTSTSTTSTSTTTTTVVPPTTVPAPVANPAGGTTPVLRVAGANLVDATGATVQLRGVNRPGLEYRCVKDFVPGNTWPSGFISDDPGTVEGTTAAYADTVARSLLSWNAPGASTNAINTVRIPLNEDCWLGINGVPAAYSGSNYQAFVTRLVGDLLGQGMYVVLDLHWGAPGQIVPEEQDVAANQDHSITFWQQVATTFRASPGVAFDLFEEPHLWCNAGSGCPYATSGTYAQQADWAWSLYRDGGNYTYTSGDWITARTGTTFQVAGTQQLVNAIRAAGATNVIFIEGLGYGNSLDQWVSHLPNDPAGQLAASQHQYQSSGANIENTTYLDATLSGSGIAGHYPLLLGELGEQICPTSTNPGFAQATMAWADSHGYSYTAWGWDQGEGCWGPSLVTSDDTGTPTVYGTVVRDHLRSLER